MLIMCMICQYGNDSASGARGMVAIFRTAGLFDCDRFPVHLQTL